MTDIVATTADGELLESDALNRILLRNARKSPAEISEMTGLPPGEVAERLSRLLEEKNWRDDLLEERLLLHEAGQLLEDLRARMRDARKDEDYASMARVQVQAIQMLLDQIRARRKSIDGDLARVSRAQARLIAEAMTIASEMAIITLMAKYPMLKEDDVRAAYEEALPHAIVTVEERVV